MTAVLLVNAAATLALVGVIWFVQVVHYPLFALVGGGGFAAYHAAHVERTTRVVVVPMLLEAVTAGLLAARPPDGVPEALAWAGAGLVVVVWLSTAVAQVPRHDRLAAGFDRTAWRELVASNWLRTAAWTARAAIVLVMLAGVA